MSVTPDDFHRLDTSEEYIWLLGAYSDHICSPDEKQDRLFADIRRLIDDYDGGIIERPYLALLQCAKSIYPATY